MACLAPERGEGPPEHRATTGSPDAPRHGAVVAPRRRRTLQRVRSVTALVIWCCWGVWAVLWFAMAFSTKRTVERPDTSRAVVVVLVVAGVVLLLRSTHLLARGGLLHRHLWGASPLVDAVAIALVVAGLAFTAWARVTLGANWSGSVVFKEDHDLIVQGPYAMVRHPIYTGLLAMMLGSAIAYAEPYGFVLLAAGTFVFVYKSRREERLMVRHFPDQYAAYRRHVKAIVPFVL